jgi:hypothetical protein
MRMRRVIAGVVLLVGAAYLAGYWPQYQRRAALDGEIATLRDQLADSEARVRMARLLGELLNVTEAVTALNYGQAQALSSQFFDEVRTEAARTHVTGFRAALESILQTRDGVTAALARADQGAVESLRKSQMQLREVLGYGTAAPRVN